jgi:hypothetical protein
MFTDADCESVFAKVPWEVSDLKNLRDLHPGDIGLVRGGETPVALVEITGRHFYKKADGTKWGWYPYRLPVRILGWYQKDRKRWPGIEFAAPAPGTFQLLTGTASVARIAMEKWLRHYAGRPVISPEWGEDEDEDNFREGARSWKKHLRIERNRKIVALVKSRAWKSGELVCAVCKFDFAEVYGVRGDGFIECHHTTPLSELAKERRVRPEDIALVCSNCHRIIHRQRPWLTLSQLSRIMMKEKGKVVRHAA